MSWILLIAKGDHAGVIEVCNTLLQIEPRSKTAHADRGDALQALGRLDMGDMTAVDGPGESRVAN